MRRPLLLIAVSTCLLAAPAAWGQIARGFSADPATAPGGVYAVDANHTNVVARVVHLGMSNFPVRFRKVAGSLTYDPRAPENSRLEITLDARQVDTNVAELNTEVPAQVFRAAEYPLIQFVSTRIERTGPRTGRITGDLTFHGVTRPLTLEAAFNGTAPGNGRARMGFSATGLIKRNDFGASAMSQWAGDEVSLQIEAEFVQRPIEERG